MNGLLRLTSDLPTLESAWEHHPFVASGLDGFDDVFSPERAEELVAAGLPVASVRLFQGGKQLPDKVLSGSARRGRTGRWLADGTTVARQVAAGATLLIEEVQRTCPAVAEFADQVAQETGCRIYCAAFLTPAGAGGVAAHYDNVGVFMRQLSGSKHWLVSAPIVPWPIHEKDPDAVMESEVVLDVVLKPGDCLYVPRGFIHAGEATDEASVHLSVGVFPTTWESVLRAVISEAARTSEELREGLRPRFAGADSTAELQARLAALAEQLAAGDYSEVLEKALRTVEPKPSYRLGTLVSALDRVQVAEDET